MTEWISIEEEFPRYNEFVEILLRDGNRVNDLNRDFAAYIQEDGMSFWTFDSMDELTWSDKGFGVTHWRYMIPDIKGRIPYLKVSKNGLYSIELKKSK